MNEIYRDIRPKNLRIAGFLNRSKVNGPGTRFVIWTQGCPIHCEGCFNPDLWEYNGGEIMSVGQLFDKIVSTAGIDGVTFSGGEPFTQAGGLAELGSLVHSHNLTVVTFTGFTYDILRAKGRASWNRLLAETDLLISGPYIAGLPLKYSHAGLCKKDIRLLTARINMEPLRAGRDAQTTEYIINRNGSLFMTGFPDQSLKAGFSGLGSNKGG
ncbi:MAG: pyruvate formate lyase-activating enzyme 1 [Methanoregula sp. PtaU1.Bin051]|nr:MAG: pyruvate formate lyase-activating enzyme 1 [Methanoregula sp. PtaU1.Bin051]